jgi:hypothetical protein
LKTFEGWASEIVCDIPGRCAALVVLVSFCAALGNACQGSPEVAQACEIPVSGNSSNWKHKGEFFGYRVEAGCSEADVVVTGTGRRWLGGVPPGNRTRNRLVAISDFHAQYLAQHQNKLSSWNGFRHGRACATDGVYAIIALQSWRDVDLAARLVGEALASADLKERVGIRLLPFTCSEPTKSASRREER